MRKLLTFRPAVSITGIALSLLCPLAFAQTAPARGIVVQGGKEAIGPKQDDPRAMQAGDCTENPVEQGDGKPAVGTNDPAARGIIVQGGLEAIGPKQDDPRSAAAGKTATRAIGPKQDDPRAKANSCIRKKAKA